MITGTEQKVHYQPPVRSIKKSHAKALHFEVEIDDPQLRLCAQKMLQLSPMLPKEEVADFVLGVLGNFSCRYCGSPLIRDGQNGSGTPEFLCKNCRKKMSIWNTFELIVWYYSKMVWALLYYIHGNGTIESTSQLFGIGKGALYEMIASMPEVKYSRNGPMEMIEYDGNIFAVITIDMTYKGMNKGVMLGVSGGMETTELGNENTGEGLDKFFEDIDQTVKADYYVFIMDMRLNVAKMILNKWGERAIIVLQNHTTWGDVVVYFNRDGWHTLRLRTDAFSEPSPKRDEGHLLGVGEIELYRGLKGVSAVTSLRDVTSNALKRYANDLILQLRNAEWDETGRIDLVMKAKIQKLNTILRELQRRKENIERYFSTIKDILKEIEKKYSTQINRHKKKKIVNAWCALKIMGDDINLLSENLLKEPLPLMNGKKKNKSEGKQKSEETKHKNVHLLSKPELIYRGKMSHHSVPEPARWVLGLLEKIFSGKEITTNKCEGRFGTIGMSLRRGRSMYLNRAVSRVHLQRQPIEVNLQWIFDNYPIRDMGKRGKRGERRQIVAGKSYRIFYVDWMKNKTERVIKVIETKRKYIRAECMLRQDVRTFKRQRIKSITPI